MTKKYTTCKTVIKQGKRRLEYVNHRSKTRLPIKVGKKGGLNLLNVVIQKKKIY